MLQPVDIDSRLQRVVAEVEVALAKSLGEAASGAPDSLLEAMRYSLLAGGKRLRPLLVLAAAEVTGGNPRLAMPGACAVEIIHTYSLIHDDLPCMDDSDLRRGRPTNHKVFGEANAVLAGDALIALAFQILADAGSHPLVGMERAARAVGELAAGAGTRGLVGGQVLDLEAELGSGRAVDVESIHRLKTGALFEASVRIGAILVGGAEPELAALSRFAGAFGLAFQIRDDLLDLAVSSAETGKPVGLDARHQKATYVTLEGREGARRLLSEQIELAISELASFGSRAALLEAVARLLHLPEGALRARTGRGEGHPAG